MARHSTVQTPQPAPKKQLTVAEMHRGIDRLRERITALEAFDPLSMKVEEPPDISALQVDIRGTLEKIFGVDTAEYRRFEAAADLQWSAAIMFEGYPAFSDYQQGIAEKISHSVAILGQAVRSLEEDIEDTAALPIRDVPKVQQNRASSKVFVVHGHDEAALHAVARFLEQLGLEKVVLREEPDQGRTIIEKFEDCASEVGFAVVLLTPDDIAQNASASGQATRARQNVVFELGYFAGKLGRRRACLLRKGAVEIPSDLYGVIYTEMDSADGWKLKLIKEMKAAKLNFDANKVFG